MVPEIPTLVIPEVYTSILQAQTMPVVSIIKKYLFISKEPYRNFAGFVSGCLMCALTCNNAKKFGGARFLANVEFGISLWH